MDLVRNLKLYSFIVLLAACLCLALSAVAQTTAPVLPPGMTGSDTNDPRAKLTPGLYDAGETASGIKHLMLVKKPDAFQLGSDNPDDPRIQKSLTTNLGIGDTSKMPSGQKLVLAQLAFANSDIAFQGNHLFQGNFYGVSIYDISNPANTKLLTTILPWRTRRRFCLQEPDVHVGRDAERPYGLRNARLPSSGGGTGRGGR